MIIDTISKNNIILLNDRCGLDGGFAASLYESYIDGGGASFGLGDYYMIIDGGQAAIIGGYSSTIFYDGILDGGTA